MVSDPVKCFLFYFFIDIGIVINGNHFLTIHDFGQDMYLQKLPVFRQAVEAMNPRRDPRFSPKYAQ